MAQAAPPSTPYGTPISMDAARKAMAAAEACATQNNWGVAIAIVDSGACCIASTTRSFRQSALPSKRPAPRPNFGGRPRCSRMRWPAAASGSAC